MITALESVEKAARQLTVSDRAALAHSLLRDFDEAEGGDLESLWAQESESRLDGFVAGDIEAADMDEVLER